MKPSQNDSWIMRASDVQGLTPQQIQSKYALSYTPTHYGCVIVDSGTQMYTGIVGPNYGMPGGGIQYDIFGQSSFVQYPGSSTYSLPLQ